jgi:hypothetical protein
VIALKDAATGLAAHDGWPAPGAAASTPQEEAATKMRLPRPAVAAAALKVAEGAAIATLIAAPAGVTVDGT